MAKSEREEGRDEEEVGEKGRETLFNVNCSFRYLKITNISHILVAH